MDPSLKTAASGMVAQQTRVDVIAHNLANVNTTGFKRSRAHFEDLLYQTVQGTGVVNGEGGETTQAVQIGRGTRLAGVQRVELQGPLEQTGRPLDLAVEGEGWFQVETPNGQMAYTRDGSFSVSDRGMLTTSGGYPLVPSITIPEEASNLTVSRTGVVAVTLGGREEPLEIGRIELARFANAPGLKAMGENLFTETPASGSPVVGNAQDDNFGRVIQGALEGSNVEIVQEMVDMITALRAYEINSKAVQSSERLAEIANGLVR